VVGHCFITKIHQVPLLLYETDHFHIIVLAFHEMEVSGTAAVKHLIWCVGIDVIVNHCWHQSACTAILRGYVMII
jgi:hypothetical protein